MREGVLFISNSRFVRLFYLFPGRNSPFSTSCARRKIAEEPIQNFTNPQEGCGKLKRLCAQLSGIASDKSHPAPTSDIRPIDLVFGPNVRKGDPPRNRRTTNLGNLHTLNKYKFTTLQTQKPNGPSNLRLLREFITKWGLLMLSMCPPYWNPIRISPPPSEGICITIERGRVLNSMVKFSGGDGLGVKFFMWG